MIRIYKFIFFSIVAAIFGVNAQSITIKGKVTDIEKETLPGVNIFLKGTANGTATDFDGNYTIDANKGDILIFSYIGYVEQQIEVDSNNIDVEMEISTENLKQVVLIGYGSTKKKNLTTSVETLNNDKFNKGPIGSFDQLLVGKTAGVQITPASGQPGTSGDIKIRGGTSSLSANNSPLIVIDGVPLDQTNTGALSYINPSDIESLTILKDASAASIYGSRATAGVILVTTKSGKTNSPLQINYNAFTSVGQVINDIEVLDRNQFAKVIRDNGTANQLFLLGNSNNDWQKKIYRAAVTRNHNLSLSKGFNHSSLRGSLGYFNQEGVLDKTNYERVTSSLKYVQKLFKNKLKIETNLRGSYIDEEFGNQGALSAAVLFDPTQSVRSNTNVFGGFTEWANPQGSPLVFAPRNPAGLIELSKNNGITKRSTGNIKFDYKNVFTRGLTASLNLGYDYSEYDGKSITDQRSAQTISGGSITNSRALNRNQLLDTYLNYKKSVFSVKNSIDVTAGYSYQKFYRSSKDITNDGLGQIFNPLPFKTQNALSSYFGRLSYAYDNRYLLSINYREDTSSRLNPRDRTDGFGGISLGWNITNENFMSKVNFLSNLKIRAGYAETGQQEINQDFGFLPRFIRGNDRARFQFGNEFVNTLRPQGIDPNLRWEVSKTINLGIDYALFNDRIKGSIDWYQRDVEDLLNFTSVPAGSNLTDAIFTNVGNLENSGLEFVINTIPIKTKSFEWDLDFNISFFKNTVTKLSLNDNDDFIGNLTGDISGGQGNRIQINTTGKEQNSFYVFQQVYDTNGKPVEGLYVDNDNDGVITDEDKRHFKSPNPDYVVGLSSLFKYEDFDFNFTWRASVGNYVYNDVAAARGNFQAVADANVISNLSSSFLDTGFQEPQLFSDYYVQDASFIRLDNVSLGYNLKNIFKENTSLRVYTTVQNALTFTNYEGIDPEVDGGIESAGTYPRSRTYLLGVNLNF